MQTERIFVAGHRGMVGSALVRALSKQPGYEVITVNRQEIDLTRDDEVDAFIEEKQPDGVIFAAARVGGILANNTYPVQFLSDNLRMAVNTIDAAYRRGVKRFLFLGSTCIYPKHAPSRFKRVHCWIVTWNQPTKPTHWPRLPASNSVSTIVDSMA